MAEFIADDDARNPNAAKPPQHTDEYKRSVLACGQRGDHLVRIHRSKWPPRSMHGLNAAMVLEQPHLRALCERCGANVIVYNPPDASLTVKLFGDASEAFGTVDDDQKSGGVVVDEVEMPQAGVVLDEPEPRRTRR